MGLDSERGSAVGSSFSPAELQFSGLYRYHVATNTWTCLREDLQAAGEEEGYSGVLVTVLG